MIENVVACVIAFVLAFVITIVRCNNISDLNVGPHQLRNRKHFNSINIYKWQHVCVSLYVERERARK